MKRWLFVLLCCVLAISAHADLSVVVGPSVMVDRQNEIFATAAGLNATLWGLVPKRPNIGVVGIIDAILYLGSSSDLYDFNDRDNIFDLFGIDEPGYEFNYDHKIGIWLSVSLWGNDMTVPGSGVKTVKGVTLPFAIPAW